MSRTSDPRRRAGCGSSRKNIKNPGWQKTAHMAIHHQRTWKKCGWRLWQAQSSSTTGGTVCGEAGRHSYGPRERETKSSCLLVDGSHRHWRGTTQTRSTHGIFYREGNSRYQLVGKMGIASCVQTGPQSNGGRHGCEKSYGNGQQGHGRMATFWDRLDRPPEKGEGLDLQDRKGRSRRQWAHSCRMGKIVE